eukprot:12884949-Prorocentrum_lima.AAC.1
MEPPPPEEPKSALATGTGVLPEGPPHLMALNMAPLPPVPEGLAVGGSASSSNPKLRRPWADDECTITDFLA